VILLAFPLWVAADSSDATLNFGPYNAIFLAGGIGIDRPLSATSTALTPNGEWSISGWIRIDSPTDGTVVVAAVGETAPDRCRCLLLVGNRLSMRIGPHEIMESGVDAGVGMWHSFASTYDGHTAHLYVDGAARAQWSRSTSAVTPSLHLAPASIEDPAGRNHFGGALALFLLGDHALTAEQVQRLHAAKPGSDFSLIPFHHVGVGWPWQEHAWRGLQEPQPAWTLPRGNAPFSAPVASVAPSAPVTPLAPVAPSGPVESTVALSRPPLQLARADTWTLGHWHLAPLSVAPQSPQEISDPGYREDHWYAAEVPGTVLTTLIANGLFPDPDVGLNNLAIPESLNRQDYWYRTLFVPPTTVEGRRFTLTFKGINYAAEVWLNGTQLGSIRGAFIRGTFDVGSLLRPGVDNALAVRISPPPHPGIPHEQSVAAGPGENGGSLAIDGPTFLASEGWDWIPAIRDRNTGIWQEVELQAHGSVRILDPQVQTRLPLPRTDVADLIIRVPVENATSEPLQAVVEARVGDIFVRKEARLRPGPGVVDFEPSEFKALRMSQPRLWWPNGYGSPDLYTLELTARIGDAISDTKSVRFGVRQITYELSLFDHTGKLRRVEVDPTAGSARNEELVSVQHEAIKRTATGWAPSLTAAGETSPAVRELPATTLTPYLVIRVNGVRIAARGGSWGTDDSRKRISRSHLEPYFRLHREAHLNIIRNWVGQNTEEVFFDLADEYGLLVLNDFWASTQDFQVEPQDPQLFLANAADVVRRFRNHPSIAVWIGRNEGVPQPVINEGLAALIAREDGTRFYTGSSNRINLQDSGPYNWRPPQQYFTELAQGFSVEVGTPSLSSLESLQQWIPEADRWPLGDVHAYHDWHFGGNGDTASFMHALEQGLGAPTDLEDFERKAQLMNYVSYRALFEGFQAGLWTKNSGRLLWMTHPAWPSNTWQIYTSDYDTPAAYYAVAKACEPLHAQLNLPDFRPAIVNIGQQAYASLNLTSRIVSLEGRVLFERLESVKVDANTLKTLAPMPLQKAIEAHGLVLVTLTLRDRSGSIVSRNVYWQAADEAHQKSLTRMPQQPLDMKVRAQTSQGETVLRISLANRTREPALLAKLTVLNADGTRILPVYYSDNYVSVMPGESQSIVVRCRASQAPASVALRGWNVVPQRKAITSPVVSASSPRA